MSVNNVNNTQSVFDQINQTNQANSTASSSKTESDSDMFMQLMIAQLQNQDPTNPADTTEFMQQIASMSTVESIGQLNSSVEDMAASLLTSQAALQASSLVGQTVYTKTDVALVDASKEVKGVIDLPVSSPDVQVSIYDASGAKVDTISIGAQTAGDHNFVWNAGDRPEGKYRIVAEAQVDGKYQVANSYIAYNVNSVTLGQNGIGMKINTAAGSVSMDDIKQIG
ncbi:flagellar hook assembly protein FlgD [Amphritea balenae]|uniref:Basal-body rod modification protein FlgD n=1 Tax=Amphritea balenae TaxID=452629 RepID=A0A3P1SSV6_9GAMM|nr:flagellar hook assembly protein FlgD [Amphritea balenae]RRC99262.1 flagellar hook assembly protein FlgD [Amphritea balenae]GGK72569.1 basal-body rod modification protein FlgD [Amphritea balenae]